MPDVPLAVKVTLADVLAQAVRLGCFTAEGVDARSPSPALDAALTEACAGFQARYGEPAAAAEHLRPARTLYHALGIDPTRDRPSSEALLRRVLLGKGLYRVNPVVDTANLCSLEMGLSVGLYDLDQVRGEVTFRVGAEGDGYPGIGKERINLAGRPALYDAEGPFGNPSSDSFRTRITEATRRILFIIFAPLVVPPGELEAHVRRAGERMTAFCRGQVDWQAVLPGRT